MLCEEGNEIRNSRTYDREGGIEISDGLNSENLAIESEGTINVSSEESLNLNLSLEEESLDLREDGDRNVKSSLGINSSRNGRAWNDISTVISLAIGRLTQFVAERLNVVVKLDDDGRETTDFSAALDSLRVGNLHISTRENLDSAVGVLHDASD